MHLKMVQYPSLDLLLLWFNFCSVSRIAAGVVYIDPVTLNWTNHCSFVVCLVCFDLLVCSPCPPHKDFIDRYKIDIKSACWQIRLEENSKDKRAFTIRLYRFCRMQFSLHNATRTFQRFIDDLLGAELETSVFCYLDNVIIAPSTFQEHIFVLSKVFERLISPRLTVNCDKCDFLKAELKYLDGW